MKMRKVLLQKPFTKFQNHTKMTHCTENFLQTYNTIVKIKVLPLCV